MALIDKSVIFVVLMVAFPVCIYSQRTCTNYVGCPDLICKLDNTRDTDFCGQVVCDGLIEANCTSADAVFQHNVTMCGCCPGCVRYHELGDDCPVTAKAPTIDPHCKDPSCPILMNKCRPGLDCNVLGSSSGKCEYDPRMSLTKCIDLRNLGLTGRLHWTPECEPDGERFAPKQCKGEFDDGICFCVDPQGSRIYGRQWKKDAFNQTCECSRQVYNRRIEGLTATVHCSPDGNYEPLQCDTDSGLCYCVDPLSGKLTGSVVPEDQWKLLPCFNPVDHTNIAGDQSGRYLRLCESEWAAGQRIAKEAMFHGTDVYAATDYDCDYDGSFTKLRREKSTVHCVPKDGLFAASDGNFAMMDLLPMTCQCFRDNLLYKEQGITLTKHCEHGTGNYQSVSPSVNSTFRCVDRDGLFYGSTVPAAYECCLRGTSPCTSCTDSTGFKYDTCEYLKP